MSNEIIGIGAVFGFTLFLILLRHSYLSFGRTKNRRTRAPTTLLEKHDLNLFRWEIGL